MRVLVNAYAVCPGKGSEPGVGWNWLRAMADAHEIHVITESEFRNQIDAEVKRLGLESRLHFHYLDIEAFWRERCWNQGDWRFYGAYRAWQKRAFEKAKELVATHSFDLIHQLSMVGYREPGYLWKLDLPFVWGPVGGAGNVPLSLLAGQRLPFIAFNGIKNTINRLQLYWGGRCRQAARKAGTGFFATTLENARLFGAAWGTPCQHIEEVGPLSEAEVRAAHSAKPSLEPGRFRICWMGHFDSRKALHLLFEALARIDHEEYEVHVLGSGAQEQAWKSMASQVLSKTSVIWHGRKSRAESLAILASCHIAAITSLKEENSTVTLEALSLGVPIVCFALSGMATVVDSTCGRCIPVSNKEESVRRLAQAIDEMRRQSDLSALSQGALERSKSLGWFQKMNTLDSIYRKTLEGR